MKKILIALTLLIGFSSLALADDNINTVAIFPGTSGVNWTIPNKTKDLFISERYGTNWTEITFWNTIQNESINWTNPYRIQSGSSFHIQDVWSSGNVMAIRGQNNSQEVDITYTVSN